jgi:diacylglycerol kinase (ATP)
MRKFQSRSFAKSAYYALNGLRLVFKTQRNFRKHLVIGLVLIGISIFMKLAPIALCMVILVNALVLICELINSIIEFVIDAYYKTKWAKLAKMAKDMGAGVVLLSSLLAVLITSILVGEKIYTLYAG